MSHFVDAHSSGTALDELNLLSDTLVPTYLYALE